MSYMYKWFPFQLSFQDGQPVCNWLFAGDTRFTRPFFPESISECRQAMYPINRDAKKSLSSLELLADWSDAMDAVKPTAFIFHVSRCGSTLASQLLSLNEKHIVLSEVPFFDQLLRNQAVIKTAVSRPFETLFSAAIRFYGQRRSGKESRLFIKTDCWHILFYEQIRSMFPDVPFILLYRRPDEVLRSQQRQWGIQAVPGLLNPALFGFTRESIKGLSIDDYMLRVLERLYEKFLEVSAKDEMTFLVDYQEGTTRMLEKIMHACRMEVSSDEFECMIERGKFHSKEPGQPFSEPDLHTPVGENLLNAVNRYGQLDARRRGIEQSANKKLKRL